MEFGRQTDSQATSFFGGQECERWVCDDEILEDESFLGSDIVIAFRHAFSQGERDFLISHCPVFADISGYSAQILISEVRGERTTLGYGTEAKVKDRLDIATADTSQATKITAKLAQANAYIEAKLTSHGAAVPVTAPADVLAALVEIESDLAAGLFLEDRGPQFKEQANRLKVRAKDDLAQLLFDHFTSGGVVVA